MPYKILKEGHKYKVINSVSGKVHSYGTTKENAEKQIRLLNMLEFKGYLR